jgi:hypothetical protein
MFVRDLGGIARELLGGIEEEVANPVRRMFLRINASADGGEAFVELLQVAGCRVSGEAGLLIDLTQTGPNGGLASEIVGHSPEGAAVFIVSEGFANQR